VLVRRDASTKISKFHKHRPVWTRFKLIPWRLVAQNKFTSSITYDAVQINQPILRKAKKGEVKV